MRFENFFTFSISPNFPQQSVEIKGDENQGGFKSQEKTNRPAGTHKPQGGGG